MKERVKLSPPTSGFVGSWLPATAPLFVVTDKNRVGPRIERRITGQRIWKVAKAVGTRAGIPELHPHALRHACGAELLRRTKNLRVVQEQLRHVDIQTTTGYTRLTQQDVRTALETFDNDGGERRIQIPLPRGTKLRGENRHRITVVAPTGFATWWANSCGSL